MRTPAFGRKNRAGGEPERLKTATGLDNFIPGSPHNFKKNYPVSRTTPPKKIMQPPCCERTLEHYLPKTLADHLKGLISKLDRRDDTPLNQAFIDCAMKLLNELPRLDSEADHG